MCVGEGSHAQVEWGPPPSQGLAENQTLEVKGCELFLTTDWLIFKKITHWCLQGTVKNTLFRELGRPVLLNDFNFCYGPWPASLVMMNLIFFTEH